MKVLSVFELSIAFSYGLLIYKRTRAKLDKENLFAMLVCLSLGWMAFCEAVFISAPTKESAWFWNQIGALGWCGYVGVTTWYFLVLVGITKKMKLFWKVIYWSICTAITLSCVIVRPTAIATDLVQSESGLGWALVQTYHNPWTFVFLLYVTIHLGGILLLLFISQKRSEDETIRSLAKGFFELDAVAIGVGMMVYFVIPYVTTFLPPMGSIALLIFLWGYSSSVWEYDLSHFELVLDPQLILDNSVEPMMITDESFRILYCNQAMQEMLHKKDLINRKMMDLLPLEERETFRDMKHLKERPVHNMAVNLLGGEAALVSINQVSTRKSSQIFYLFSMHDISQMHRNQMQMEHMAYYDELTGLANRRRLGELLDVWEKDYQVYGKDFILIFLDLNRFKVINDKYGHDAGDMALIAVSNHLKSMIRPGDETFRLAGDEFVILHAMKELENVDDIVQNIKKELQSIDTKEFAASERIDASVGTCLFSEFHNVRQMMKTADERMYEMKQAYHRK